MEIEKTQTTIKISLSILALTISTGVYTMNIQQIKSEAKTEKREESFMKMNTSLMQTLGSQLMQCRLQQRVELCKQYRRDSYNCQMVMDIDRDGIFTSIRTKKFDDIEIGIQVDQALKSCRGLYE